MWRAPFLVPVFILAMAAAACGSDGPAGVVDHVEYVSTTSTNEPSAAWLSVPLVGAVTTAFTVSAAPLSFTSTPLAALVVSATSALVVYASLAAVGRTVSVTVAMSET